METKIKKRYLKGGLFAGILGAVALVGLACSGGGVAQDDFDALKERVNDLDSSLETLDTTITQLEQLAGMIGMIPGGDGNTPNPGTGDPDPALTPDGDVSFVHGAFDTAPEIEQNIDAGVTLFRIDQQQPLQGYGAIMALALQVRYGIVPASPITLTGPGLIGQAEQAGGTVTSRYPFGDAGNYPSLDDIRTQAGEVELIAIQHAECGQDSFWCTVQEGINQAADDTNVNVEIRAPAQGETAEDRLPALVREAVAAQPDGILLTYTFPNNAQFRSAVQSALDEGIPIVAYNAGRGPIEDDIEYLTFYGQDEYEAGRQAATRLIAAAQAAGLTPTGVCINHDIGNSSTDARCRGFRDVFDATSGANLIGDSSGVSNGVLGTTDDPTTSTSTITDFYAANGDVNVFLTNGPVSAGPFYTFVDDEALDNDDFIHGTFDTDDVINENIRSGRTEFGIDQQPFLQGYGAVTSLYLNWLFNALPPSAVTLTGPGFVTTANIDDIPANVDGYRTARENEVDLLVFDHGGPTNEWWETMRQTVQLAAENLGVNVQTATSEIGDNADSALTALQGLAANQADGYVITLLSNNPSASAWQDAANALVDQAPVVVYNAGAGPEADGIDYVTFIGQTEYEAGLIAGQALARAVQSSGLANPLAICLNQGVGSTNLDSRCNGFRDAMQAAGIALAGNNGVLAISNDVPASATTLSDFYSANSGVNVFLTLGPDPARAFYQFLDDEDLN